SSFDHLLPVQGSVKATPRVTILSPEAKDPRNALAAYREGFPDLDTAIRLDPSYAPVRRHRGNTIVATYNALIPPLGTTSCRQAQTCDQFGNCRWQQVCR